jgi:hypothetical protein
MSRVKESIYPLLFALLLTGLGTSTLLHAQSGIYKEIMEPTLIATGLLSGGNGELVPLQTDDGRFVVIYALSGAEVFFRIYIRKGTEIEGSPFYIGTGNNQGNPSLSSLPDGSFVVAVPQSYVNVPPWSSKIMGFRFDADGNSIGESRLDALSPLLLMIKMPR